MFRIIFLRETFWPTQAALFLYLLNDTSCTGEALAESVSAVYAHNVRKPWDYVNVPLRRQFTLKKNLFWNLSLVADILGVNLFWWWVVFSEAAHCVLSLWIESLIAKSYRVSIHLIDFLIRNASATSRTMELYYPSLLGWLMWMWHNSENERCPEQEALKIQLF